MSRVQPHHVHGVNVIGVRLLHLIPGICRSNDFVDDRRDFIRAVTRQVPQDALTALRDSGDLERLAARVGQFNLFEAVGMVRQEVRHSYLLAHLLNPRESHGLGDSFLRRFLRLLGNAMGESLVAASVPDPERLSLDRAVVHREWEFVDVLVEVEAERLLVLVENKVDSAEHSDQLNRYVQKVRERYPGWQVLPVFLSPGGTRPSMDEFIAVDYGLVCAVLDEVLAEVSNIQPDVRMVLEHYRQMLRRHIMSDSDIAQLCREIYREHKVALDLIFEHRPDLQSGVRDLLRGPVQCHNRLRLIQGSKQYTTFLPVAWDGASTLKSGLGWDFGGNRVLAFQSEYTEAATTLHLCAGPVPEGQEEVRDRLLEIARRESPPFGVAPKRFNPKFWSVYQKPFLTAVDYEYTDAADLERRIRERWAEFLQTELPAIDVIIQGDEALWYPSASA